MLRHCMMTMENVVASCSASVVIFGNEVGPKYARGKERELISTRYMRRVWRFFMAWMTTVGN